MVAKAILQATLCLDERDSDAIRSGLYPTWPVMLSGDETPIMHRASGIEGKRGEGALQRLGGMG